MTSFKKFSMMVAVFMVFLLATAFYGTPAFGQANMGLMSMG